MTTFTIIPWPDEHQHPPNYLTVREVAALLRIGKNKVYDLIHAGELPAIRLGSTYRVRRASLEA